MTEPHPPRSSRSPRTGSARCASWRTPTTWSSARPRPSPAGPARARRSSTAWSPAARPASTAWRPTSAARSARPSRSSPRAIVGVDDGRLPRPARRHPRVRRRRCAARSPRRSACTGPTSSSPTTSATRGAAATSTRPTTSPPARPPLDAVRDAGNRWVFPEQLVGGLEPWGGVRRCGRRARPSPTHGVDTTDTFDRGVESLRAHQAYIDGLGLGELRPGRVPRGHVARPTGQRLGVAHGAGSRCSRCGTASSCSPGWTRTNNPPVNSRMLCQLSYRGSCGAIG